MTAFVANTARSHNAIHGVDGRISMCVYAVTNTANGKRYVGQTIGRAFDRWKGHRSMKSGSGVSLLKNAINKYGKDAFVFEVIDIAETVEQLNHKERFWISHLGTLAPDGYNIDAGGNCSGKVSEATKAKLRIANKAAYEKDPTLKQRCMRGVVNRKQTDDEKLARSLAVKKAHQMDETLTHRKTAHAKGKQRSEEIREKIRAALLGRRHSPERIAAIKRGMEKSK